MRVAVIRKGWLGRHGHCCPQEIGLVLVQPEALDELLAKLGRSIDHVSEYYFREALDILGYEYDVYDVEVPGSETSMSDGPDYVGMKYYDTQIWFTDEFNAYTIKPVDQVNLINWLAQAYLLAEDALDGSLSLMILGDNIFFWYRDGFFLKTDKILTAVAEVISWSPSASSFCWYCWL